MKIELEVVRIDCQDIITSSGCADVQLMGGDCPCNTLAGATMA